MVNNYKDKIFIFFFCEVAKQRNKVALLSKTVNCFAKHTIGQNGIDRRERS